MLGCTRGGSYAARLRRPNRRGCGPGDLLADLVDVDATVLVGSGGHLAVR